MKYSVALCTYNGAKYIKDQLQSILDQTVPVDEITICDDASRDNTLDVIRKFSAENPHIKITVLENIPALGVRKNFERALKGCSGDLIFLSDQDDIWLKTKVESVLRFIEEKKINIQEPVMLFSDLEVVNENLSLISPSLWRLSRFSIPDDQISQLTTLMVQNFVTGAGSIVSKKLVEMASPFPPQIPMHDHWLALVAANFGRLYKITQPLVKYRQHSANVVGAKTPNLARFVVRLLSGKVSLMKESKDFWNKRKQIEGLIRIGSNLSPERLKLLKDGESALRNGGFKSVLFASKNNFLPMQLDLKLLFYVYLLILPVMAKQEDRP